MTSFDAIDADDLRVPCTCARRTVDASTITIVVKKMQPADRKRQARHLIAPGNVVASALSESPSA